ncbi:MAG: HisA/HisF-related TIM barrel protein, partial [Planctomycetota bacterium]|nr:HisA/HisF-related TIM barrel protein [Planctomycetota bacterium]
VSSDVSPAWSRATPLQIVDQVIQLGIKTMIVLDLAAVGMGKGIPTLNLCRQIKQQYPTLELITGGGVNSKTDLTKLESYCDGVLIASALHDGRLTAEDLGCYG